MYLTISKRFEFCASHRCFIPAFSEKKHLELYGDESRGNYGHGHNYVAYFVFHGPLDPRTGLMINFSLIKNKVGELIESGFDHKYLNSDTPPFDKIPPTLENLTYVLLQRSQTLFSGEKVQPVACHVSESTECSGTAYANGKVERDFWMEFSAARRTYSPNLAEEENLSLFGQAASPSGHGHNYRLRVTISGEVSAEHGLIMPLPLAQQALREVHRELDHKNLNTDVAGLKGLPTTTEMLARYIWDRLQKTLPVNRIRLYEKSDFSVEYCGHNNFYMTIEDKFQAAHRLYSLNLSEKENREVYGKCNNPNGHGHQYKVECAIGGKFDERSGILYNLVEVNQVLSSTLSEWDYKHLELETEDFKNTPSTGENIIEILWKKLDPQYNGNLHRLRIWETPNNRITLRREIPA